MSHTPQPEPTVHEFTTNQRLYEAQTWIDRQLNRREFSADVAPHVTVSLVRSAATGLWSATMYGWPAVEVHTEDVPGQDGAPMIYAGEPVEQSWRQVGPGVYTAPVGTPDPVEPLMLGGDTELWTAGNPASARPVADLGDIASHRPVPVVPGMFDSAVQAAIDAEQDNARAAVLAPTRLDLKRTAGAFALPAAVRPSVYEDPRPLSLDLDTEEPKPRKESRRARKERERREQAEAVVAEAVRAADAMAGSRVLAQESYTVPASGHRPDANGVAPVEYPKCTSMIEVFNGGDQREVCKRNHRPGDGDPTHSAGGFVWKNNDPRIVRAS